MNFLSTVSTFKIIGLIILILASLFFIQKKKPNYALLSILFLGLLLRISLAWKFELNTWDEQFHALVSKNMLTNPLKPMLYPTSIPFLDPSNWTFCNLWLSKPPLTFWVIALSLKTFGINEIGLRLPSIIFGSACIYLTFKIGVLLFNQKIGLLAAFFHAINGIYLEVNSGKMSADHVDTLYLFLCELTIFYFLKNMISLSKKHFIIIGCLAGLAFMTKWIMAFLIFLIIIPIIFYVQKKKAFIPIIIIITSFTVVSSPWILYLFFNFPIEFKIFLVQLFEPIYKTTHIDNISLLYYFSEIRMSLSEIVYIPLIFLLYYSIKKPSISRFILSVWILLPMILLSFFTFKKNTYILTIAPAIFILIALFLRFILQILIKYHKIVNYILVISIFSFPIRNSIERLKINETSCFPKWRVYIENYLQTHISSKTFIIVNDQNAFQTMFFYSNILSFNNLTKEQIGQLNLEKYILLRYENGKLINL